MNGDDCGGVAVVRRKWCGELKIDINGGGEALMSLLIWGPRGVQAARRREEDVADDRWDGGCKRRGKRLRLCLAEESPRHLNR